MTTGFALHCISIYDRGTRIDDALLVIRQGRIHYAGPRRERELPADLPLIDGHGWGVSPGLIDLQFNGAYGHDFTRDPSSLLAVARRLPETGVTAFLPTFITSPIDSYIEKLNRVRIAQQAQSQRGETGARILGAHVEGPFLNPAKKGAHRQEWFIDPTLEALEQLQPLEAVRLLTLAPERAHGLQAVRWLSERGVVVSIGHSAAGPQETCAAVEAGAALATHLYNAMRPMDHRDPGLVGALLVNDTIRCGLIVDGVHVHPLMVRLAYRLLGPERIALVTDAMAAMGMPSGESLIGDQTVYVDETSARLADGTLAGSILRLDQAVRNMVAFSGCSPAQALQMATSTPAAVLGLEGEMGRLAPGCPADLAIWDSSLHLQATFMDGRPVYTASAVQPLFASLPSPV